MTGTNLEENRELALDYGRVASIKQPVIPVAVQDADSKEVLIVAYANKAALDHTIKKKLATFWSISRDELWVKGATSGDYLDVVEVRINCEQNSALYLVRPRTGGACHTRDQHGQTRKSCFYRRIQGPLLLEFL
ncbi:MAG: phosphoribosyl-AMP cyclohydrolase [Spirochaetales bacterium]|nr:phosphoribosyl-AMP cyclohydrolase [Spirochaetales bacterium]